jgi:hypothetical protein
MKEEEEEEKLTRSKNQEKIRRNDILRVFSSRSLFIPCNKHCKSNGNAVKKTRQRAYLQKSFPTTVMNRFCGG